MIACVIGLGIALTLLMVAFLILLVRCRDLAETHAELVAYTSLLLDRPRFYAAERQENILASCTDPEAN